MEIKRLFDIPYYQLKNSPLEKSLSYKVDGNWKSFSSQEFVSISNQVSQAFLKLGIKKEDKIAIITSTNRPEFNFIDIGSLQIGAINVPLYPTISAEEYAYCMNDSECKLAFVSDKEIYDKLTSVKNQIPSLQDIYTFDTVNGAKSLQDFLVFSDEVLQPEVEKIKSTIDALDLATLIYTSGTTGKPKGVMLSHNNIISNVNGSMPTFDDADPLLIKEDHFTVFSFLPINHVFERMVNYTYMVKGASIYYAEGLDKIADNLKEVRPHIFTTVPRLLEKVYEKIYAKGDELTGIKRKLFFWALKLGFKYEYGKRGLGLAIANKLIFSKWREALGGRVIMIVSGSAALQERLARVFTAGKIPILEGYGLTETSPVISVNRLYETNKGAQKFGTIGTIIDGIEVKIAEDGEILSKGPHITMGYYKQPEQTAQVIDKDGWFHTGDIGELVDGKFLKITDRKKEMFKTSGGKYCAPQPIENKYKESPLIDQIIVVGEGKKFIAAIIQPSFENLKNWCGQHGIPFGSISEVIANEKVLAEYERIKNEFNPLFSHVEQIKKFRLVSDEWSVESGEMTPTMKLKRKVIHEKYKNLIEQIYRP